MSQRILTLTTYLYRSLLFSLAGLLYILVALAFYLVLFEPRQRTPDVDYYFLVIGIFGLALSFLVTLSVSSRANRAEHFPFLVRLPSRVEYLTAVMLAGFLFAFILQIVIALLAKFVNGPTLDLQQILVIVPVWLAIDILFVILALHATDLVALGWSRVYVFGILGILLYLQSGNVLIRDWLAGLFRDIGETMLNRGINGLSAIAYDISSWLTHTGADLIDQVFGFVFWPFSAISNAAVNGSFTLSQALAPAIILLYATALFILAASLFSRKDLFLTE
jgi:hypothetical protein